MRRSRLLLFFPSGQGHIRIIQSSEYFAPAAAENSLQNIRMVPKRQLRVWDDFTLALRNIGATSANNDTL